MRLRRAFAVVIVLIAVALGIAVVSGFQLYGDAVADREQQSLETTAGATATQLDGLLDERSRTIELHATDPAVLNDSQRRRATLKRLVRQTPFQGVSVVRADGTMTALESEGLSAENRTALLGSDFSDRTYFQEALTGRTYVSEPVEAETGNLIVTISTPIREDGTVVGTLNGALHISEGTFFESLSILDDTDHQIRVSAGDQPLYTSGSFADEESGPTATATVASTGWTVTAMQVEDSSREAQLATGLQFGSGLLVLVSVVVFGAWFKRSNLNQIDRLLDGFDRLAERSYGTQISVGGAQEWDEIGTRFNEVSKELARHERELKRYREIVERVADPIALQTIDGEHRLVNHALAEVSGYSRDDILGADESRYLDADAAERVAEKREQVLEMERPIEYELDVTFERTGTEATFSTQQYPYYDEDGELAGTLSVYRDVTDLKERESELKQYKRAVDGATDLICAVGQNFEYLFANPQYCAYHGLDQESVPGTPTSAVFSEDNTEITERAKRVLNGETVKYKMRRTHPSGGERILDVRYYPLGEQEVTGFVAVLRDVTEREERARQLRVVDRVLRHNLRNDLTVISLEAERIESASDGIVADSAEVIQDHADGLLTTSDKSRSITEVLGEEPERSRVDVTTLLERVTDSVEEDTAEVTLDTPDGEVTVSAVTYLEEAIGELVTNAIVHSDRARPSVELSVEEAADQVTVRVADDGPGIAQMDRDVLESGRAIEDLYHGSGLGLWLVYWIVKRSGGSITVSDRTPRGTLVEIELQKQAE